MRGIEFEMRSKGKHDSYSLAEFCGPVVRSRDAAQKRLILTSEFCRQHHQEIVGTG
jgi:hypothetical protein